MTHCRSGPALIAAALLLGGCGFSAGMPWQARTTQAPAPATPTAAAATDTSKPPAAETQKPESAETRKPFVVIRFEEPDPDYAASLYDALSGALKRRPGTGFDLVAVTRDADAAERNLASVFRTMTAMGMPSGRLSLSAVAAADTATDEVWIYLR
jgi:hypothetical protein